MVDSPRHSHPVAPHRVPPTRQQIIAQVLVSAVILVSGVVIGGGGTILALRDRIIPPFESEKIDSPPSGQDGDEAEKRSSFVADRIRQQYELNDEQTRQVKAVFAQQFAATEELWNKFRQAEQDQRDKLAQAIKTILTPEQFAKWDSDYKKMVQHMDRMRPFEPRRGGRGGPPWERGDGPPDFRKDPDDNRRGGWRPGPPKDSNDMMRGDRPRDGLRGPGGPRGDWGRDRSRDPNDQRERRPTESPMMEPNGPPPGMREPG
ncbi:MAG TPA: hypothetical protein VLI39_07800 [Sedimentisphaerales bacterium]|nr:hypothetical protein [Sedimentisphaerales bacterium]